MPHRPNPIPRYNASNLTSSLHDQPTRRDKDGLLPPRHRASSGASDLASPPTNMGPSTSSMTHGGGPTAHGATGGGDRGDRGGGGARPSGRALPPPRFQRKQRPPRVQQAIAAAAAVAASSTSPSSASPSSTTATNANAVGHTQTQGQTPTTQGGRRGKEGRAGGMGGGGGNGGLGGGTGTLTLGPANNWGAGTSAVVSLSMATINAASARASVVHPRQQHPPPPAPSIPTVVPPLVPTIPNANVNSNSGAFDDLLIDRYGHDLQGLGLDPVQLHNRITFGMGRVGNTTRHEVYPSEYLHLQLQQIANPNSAGMGGYSNVQQAPGQTLGHGPGLGAELDGYGGVLGGGVVGAAGGVLGGGGIGGSGRNHASVRARPQSHNQPASALYHHQLGNVQAVQHPGVPGVQHHVGHGVAGVQDSRTYSPIHPTSSAASSFGLETPPMVHAAHQHPQAVHQHLQGTQQHPPGGQGGHLIQQRPHSGIGATITTVDFDGQLRIRSQSLMAPVDSYGPSRESLTFPVAPSSAQHPSHSALHSQTHRQQQQSPFPNALSNVTTNTARYNSTSSMQAQHHLSLNTDLCNHDGYTDSLSPKISSSTYLTSSGSALPSILGPGTHPSSSALSGSGNRKPLKSALKARKSAPELMDSGVGGSHSPPPAMPGLPRSDGGHEAPDSESGLGSYTMFPPPDPGFHLPNESLQAQYAHQLQLLQKEYATKAAKAEKARRRSLERRAGGVERPDGAEEGLDGGQEVVMPVRGRVSLGTTPPSSGGGSASGRCVAFFEQIEVLGQEQDQTGAEMVEQDNVGGYLSWDDGWTGEEGDDEVTEFVYSPSAGGNAGGASGMVQRQNTALSPGTENSDSEDDGGSDIGDRGHDDTVHSTGRQQSSRNTLSPVGSTISPVHAVVHGHEPSPLSTESVDHDDAQGDLLVSGPAHDTPSLLPLVEIIAPTPIISSKELVPAEELPKFDEMDKEDGIMGGVTPTSSTDSTESSDSNSTLKTGLVDGTVGGDKATTTPVIVEDTSVTHAFSPLDITIEDTSVDLATSHSSTKQASYQKQEGATAPQLPPTLQRLARRISRGTPPIPQPSSSSTVPPGPPPEQCQAPYFQDMAPLEHVDDDDESLRRLSSITSLSSASSGLHATIFPRPPVTHSLDRDLFQGRSSTFRPNDLASHGIHNRMVCDTGLSPEYSLIDFQPPKPVVPPPIPLQAVCRPPSDSVVPDTHARRISRQSALADYSSAASVESGSSHGGGTSGTSHGHRARGRSVAGSMLSTSSSGSHHRNLRVLPGPLFGQANVLSASNSSPGMDSLPSHASPEQWDRGPLSNARSSESLGAVSAASGRSGGSGGSSGKGSGRALGGESIWTLGKEEEAGWPPAPPSSSGHGHSNQSKGQNQYTLRSLIPQAEAAMSLSSQSIFDTRERMNMVYPDSQHSYEQSPPNDTLDSFYPFYDPYSLPPPESDRLRLSMQQSRSAPILSIYEADQAQGLYHDSGRRGDFRRSTVRHNWQDKPEDPIGQHQDEPSFIPSVQGQLRAQAPPFAPASKRHSVVPRLPPQASTRSLPIMNPPEPRGTFNSQRNHEEDGGINSSGYPVSVPSRPSTARSALYLGPGAEDADHYATQKSIMTLPATGGVFPRYQPRAAPYAEPPAVRPGSSGGRFKSLFKSRDSRVFK